VITFYMPSPEIAQSEIGWRISTHSQPGPDVPHGLGQHVDSEIAELNSISYARSHPDHLRAAAAAIDQGACSLSPLHNERSTDDKNFTGVAAAELATSCLLKNVDAFAYTAHPPVRVACLL
jgi:hypothetical protein